MDRRKVTLRLLGCGLIAGLTVLNLRPAMAFHNEIETLDALAPGPNNFSGHGGDVIMIRAQSAGGNTTCFPVVTPTESLLPMGEVKRTASDKTYIFEVYEDGTYEYSLPTPLDETGSCSITVGLATRYETLILEAQELERNSYWVVSEEDTAKFLQRQQDTMALYQEAIDLEPEYPDAYKRVLELLLEINVTDFDLEQDGLDELGEIFLHWPDSARMTMINHLEALAQIYEKSPDWQEEKGDDPLFLKGFAEFVQTGNAPDVVRELLLEGRGG
ncbi:hypothetical protein QGP82_19750 [Leptothoe sp. LEGE 181152]|nr:hypothetical protein [Leptothoe sp. LEGE 181152]